MAEMILEKVQKDKEANLDQMEKPVQRVNLVKKQEHYMLVAAELVVTIIQQQVLLFLEELAAQEVAVPVERHMHILHKKAAMELLILVAVVAELHRKVELVAQE